MLSTQRPKPLAVDPPSADPVDALLAAAVDDAPVASSPVVETPPPVSVAETQTPGLDMGVDYVFEGPLIHEGVPDPPPCVQRKLDAKNLAFRWLSTPHTDRRGLRMYSTYSATVEDRAEIDKGHCHPGIRIHADNRITWGEDAFLATIPKHILAARDAARRRASRDQSALAKSRDTLSHAAERIGSRINLSVREHVSNREDD